MGVEGERAIDIPLIVPGTLEIIGVAGPVFTESGALAVDPSPEDTTDLGEARPAWSG